MATPDFAISAEEVNHGAVVAVRGEVDLSTAPLLEERLSQFTQVEKLVVDLTEVSFLDSTGLAVLVRTANKLGEHGGAIRLVVRHPEVLKVLEITGLTSTLGVHSSLDQALST